jgi:hypothetical protein
MAYGTPPIARRVGGLADTVVGYDTSNGAAATGFTFDTPDPLALRELQAWWLQSGSPTSGPVFTWQGKPIANFKKALATAVKKAGITKRITRYTLRHTFATAAVEGGAPVTQVAAMMRHTDPRMVQRTYDHSEVVRTVNQDVFPDWRGPGSRPDAAIPPATSSGESHDEPSNHR